MSYNNKPLFIYDVLELDKFKSLNNKNKSIKTIEGILSIQNIQTYSFDE